MKGQGKGISTPAEVGHRMHERRMMLGMSHESGVNRVEQLAATLRVPITHFLDRHPPENGHGEGFGQDLTAFLATPEGLALCTAFQMIDSESMCSAFIDLLQGMVTKH